MTKYRVTFTNGSGHVFATTEMADSVTDAVYDAFETVPAAMHDVTLESVAYETETKVIRHECNGSQPRGNGWKVFHYEEIADHGPFVVWLREKTNGGVV